MKKFYLGMDIGTESVGMACSDENYNLLRSKGKDLWAVRLFDEAKSAEERRTQRAARRRLARRSQRIDLLQEIFARFMTDELFFIRLNNSGFNFGDKDYSLKSPYSLFSDDNFTDKDFYAKYPTIFHLREAIIEDNLDCQDLRLYYLALHHIIKYRGHFLFEGESIRDIGDIKQLFREFNETFVDLFPDNYITLPEDKAVEFKKLALENKGLNDKKRESAELFGTNDSQVKEFLTLFLGGNAKASVLFGNEYADKYKGEKLNFRESKDEEFEAKAELFDDNFRLLEISRAIYNYLTFEKILYGNKNISSAMIKLYDKHKKDLELLKRFLRTQCAKGAYYKVLRSTNEESNYVNYIGYTITKGERKNVKKCKNKADFYKFIEKVIQENESNFTDPTLANYIREQITEDNFLPKILNSDNGLFPHQINGSELGSILKVLCSHFPNFEEKDIDGFSPAQKIKSIFLFKIPYYVGPLNNYHENGGNSWIVRKKGAIRPWNFSEMVDMKASNEKFIKRMTNKCTYLHGKDVLPKCSMYYQAYNVLNQLNKLKLNEIPISIGLKQELFNELFLKKKKVTKKMIKDYLASTAKLTKQKADELIIGGFDGELNASMSSYITLKKILGNLVDIKPEICENIILWHTLFTEKKLVEDAIKEEYSDIPVVIENVKLLKGITSFKEFGRLSKELLLSVSGGINPVTKTAYSILERLYNTNSNFNELYHSDEYKFKNSIELENGEYSDVVTYRDIEDLYVSPMVRRGIWQALIMCDEYVNAVGRTPDKIFVEVTRKADKDKQRTVSRKNQLLNLYKGLKKDCQEIDELNDELNRKTDSQLRQERLYLYFAQLGRCAYTGKRIDLTELSTDLYDVDHIMPRSITKNDSLDNKVLVLRQKNKEKTDIYPLPVGFTNQQAFWKMLYTKGLMSDIKYALLTRTEPLNETDFKEFVNRQLVVTNQTAKVVAELLARKYANSGTKIVYSKASNVIDFKQRYDIVKCRETNDLHHARDAYLNIVIGNVYDTKFTNAYDYFYRNKDGAWREYNLKNLYSQPIKNAWNGSADIQRIKSVLVKPSMQVTRYSFTNKGGFYNETVFKKEDKGVSAPRKNKFPYNQTEKYGGYKSLNTAYFIILQSKDKKGTFIKTIEAVPVLVDYNCKGDRQKLLEYFTDCGLIEPEIIVDKIKVKSLVSVNGYMVWIAGMTGNQVLLHNAQQWYTDETVDSYVNNCLKLIEQERNRKISEEETKGELFMMSTNRFGEVKAKIDRLQNVELYGRIIDKLSKLNSVITADGKEKIRLMPINSFKDKLIAKTDLFEKLSVFKQAQVLLQLVQFMKCNSTTANLTLLDDGSSCGKLLISKNITDVKFEIINQSPCGLTTHTKSI